MIYENVDRPIGLDPVNNFNKSRKTGRAWYAISRVQVHAVCLRAVKCIAWLSKHLERKKIFVTFFMNKISREKLIKKKYWFTVQQDQFFERFLLFKCLRFKNKNPPRFKLLTIKSIFWVFTPIHSYNNCSLWVCHLPLFASATNMSAVSQNRLVGGVSKLWNFPEACRVSKRRKVN